MPNLTDVVLYLLTKRILQEDFKDNFVIFAENYPWRNLLLRNLQFVEPQFFLNKALRQIDFSGIYENSTVEIWTAKCDLDKEY